MEAYYNNNNRKNGVHSYHTREAKVIQNHSKAKRAAHSSPPINPAVDSSILFYLLLVLVLILILIRALSS